ncbi:unnamed protein product [Ilex paraguariensis]|uniref:Alpha-ketoglutarate-dependent dioxygenase AlkB-like domain-containing protein n=1 Tax=Ilex paraguariensis TaxID=185542 RepID=A0ABC8U4E3_9AQUA
MIQLGHPVVDAAAEDDALAGTYKDRRLEPIPGFMQDVIERLIAMQIVTVKPDSCIIDIFKEGDHSQPHMWPHWFGRPVCVLFLTECDMTFGKVILADHPGDYRGSLKLSLTPGSMLVMQGRAADFARHALPSLRKHRVLVTLTKSQPRKTPSDGQRFSSPVVTSHSHWVSPPSRSPNHIRHPVGPKHYGSLPTTGVLPAPAACPQLPPPNGIQPIFVPSTVATAMPFPAPVSLQPASAGWTAAPPPRLPVPGTGVFLPPGSGNASTPSLSLATATESFSMETLSLSEKGNGSGKPNGNNSAYPKGKVDEIVQWQECNGMNDGTGGTMLTTKEEQQQSVDSNTAGKPAGAV